MLSRSTFGRNAPRALQKQCSAAGASSRRGMASAATPGLQYDVTESAGVKVANREVAGPTGTLALVAKAGPRYQPVPGFSDALEQFAFKVRPFWHRSDPSRSISHLSAAQSNAILLSMDSPRSNGRHCGSIGKSNCWAVKFPRHTRARTSSSRPSSSRAIFPTSPNSLRRLLLRPSLLVSQKHEGPPSPADRSNSDSQPTS